MTKQIKYSANGYGLQQCIGYANRGRNPNSVGSHKYSLSSRLRKLVMQDQGSFSLEASIVFPILLGFILLFILFGMYMYQKVVLYYAASSSADRTAFAWDNSHRNSRSGMLEEETYDGLYWRMGDDGMLSSVFGLAEDSESAVAALPAASSQDQDSDAGLAELKLWKASVKSLGSGESYAGELSYNRSTLLRKVEVKLKRPFELPAPSLSFPVREPKTVASATIVDPVEFIRSVDLARYYISRFAGVGGGGAGSAKVHAGEVLAPYKEAGR